MKYTSRAQLLRDATDSIEMQEKSGIEPVAKFLSRTRGMTIATLSRLALEERYEYEFPLAVVEGKPVFLGDELYYSKTGALIRAEHCNFEICDKNYSWNPPKPKTVMVELLVEDAKFIRDYGITSRVTGACRKALEELK